MTLMLQVLANYMTENALHSILPASPRRSVFVEMILLPYPRLVVDYLS